MDVIQFFYNGEVTKAILIKNRLQEILLLLRLFQLKILKKVKFLQKKIFG